MANDAAIALLNPIAIARGDAITLSNKRICLANERKRSGKRHSPMMIGARRHDAVATA